MQRKKDLINAVQAGKLTAASDILDKDNWSTSEDEDSGGSESDVGTASESESNDGKAAWKAPGEFDDSTSNASALQQQNSVQNDYFNKGGASRTMLYYFAMLNQVFFNGRFTSQESVPTTVIRLATSCCTLSVQQRAILRRQLKAGEDALKTAAVQRNVMTDSSLLST
eukprot:gene11623-11767_t